jgi:hypothetical protein
MIVHKIWVERSRGGLVTTRCEGWYLFGFIPLFIRRDSVGGEQ